MLGAAVVAFGDDSVRAAVHVLFDAALALESDDEELSEEGLRLAVHRLYEVGVIKLEQDEAGDFPIQLDSLVAACALLVNRAAGLAALATGETLEEYVRAMQDAVNMPPDPFREEEL